MKKNNFTWSDAIEKVIRRNDNIATLKLLHEEAPLIYAEHNEIKGLTPHKTIDERVQRDKRFYKLVPGLYTLVDTFDSLPKDVNPTTQTAEQKENLTHVSMQALLLQLGQYYQYRTFTPDKKKQYLSQKLGELSSLEEFPKFTYDRIVKRTRNIDVSWFNERGMPSRVFEVENSTDIKNGLSKFMELVDFKTSMFVVAPAKRENEFKNILKQPSFKPIEKQVQFWTYEKVEKLFNSERETFELRSQLI
ncbi:MAG: hypothetical protein KF855_00605 [Acidobacteria bacterium]|nr:hypothetical protein [Acidobacteriota bacterium]